MLMNARGEVALPDPALLRRFDIPGPRYTSYPTADRFVEAFDSAAFEQALAGRATALASPSLVVVRPPAVLQHGLLLLRLQQGHYQGQEQVRRIHRIRRA
jgi:hypothetical protein